MNKKMLIIHGWEADSRSNWFPRAKTYFEKNGYEVFVPDLPGGYSPNFNAWMEIIKKNSPDKDWIIIGHSLGGVAALRFLETSLKPIKQLILVATPFEKMNFEKLAEFLDKPFDWAQIKKNVSKINLVYESDDPVVPLNHGKQYSKALNASLKVIDGSLHLCRLDPQILNGLI